MNVPSLKLIHLSCLGQFNAAEFDAPRFLGNLAISLWSYRKDLTPDVDVRTPAAVQY